MNVYDQSYFYFFANGKQISQIDKDRRMSNFFKKSFRKALFKEVNVDNEADLCYTFIDLYEHEDKFEDYSPDDYRDEYQKIIEFCHKNNIKPIFKKVNIDYIEENY